jgi:monofunctional biosynthetic peptidoglycan transglycosylase
MDLSKFNFSVSKALKILSGLAIGYTFWFFMLLFILRWVNVPYTSFTLQEDWDELGQERYSLTEYWVPQEEIPDNIQWAVVASEDQRFWKHSGIDLVAIGKAIEEREEEGRVRGASTISQQVSKNLFLWGGKSYFRKGVEAVITLGIEVVWPKERIMEVYLNIAEFGPGVYGIGKASEHFFGKDASELKPEESARLAAVLPNPKRMRVEPPSPFVAERKHWILRNMTQLSGIAYVPKPEPVEEREVNYSDSVSVSIARLSNAQPTMWIPSKDTSVYNRQFKEMREF